MPRRVGFLLLVVIVPAMGHAAGGAPDPAPVLVELFTSEGCSSCPPADALLATLVEAQPVQGARVIALGEHVDYWDGLGWKDPFSRPVFTRRQADYVRRFRLTSAYTPQMVVNGRRQLPGGDGGGARRAIAAAASEPSGDLVLTLAAGGEQTAPLSIAARWPSGVDADVFVATVEERATSRPARGENAGRTLTHVAAAVSFRRVGSGTGRFSGTVRLDGLCGLAAPAAVVFVQERDGGPVLAVERAALPRAAGQTPCREPAAAMAPGARSRPSAP
jgi:hypothetical protein